ncbi:uncharacterized protein SPSC_10002 [Sporisorium scitamineum]|uniref:Effector family protein Eff1 n=1 Tax=Sporisorium scitamineum TaxID=49012 RepID=A0A127ZIU9_9BASI|nr:uncharacterized protein SPSC_10002 [Sporisorium scitamineum]
MLVRSIALLSGLLLAQQLAVAVPMFRPEQRWDWRQFHQGPPETGTSMQNWQTESTPNDLHGSKFDNTHALSSSLSTVSWSIPTPTNKCVLRKDQTLTLKGGGGGALQSEKDPIRRGPVGGSPPTLLPEIPRDPPMKVNSLSGKALIEDSQVHKLINSEFFDNTVNFVPGKGNSIVSRHSLRDRSPIRRPSRKLGSTKGAGMDVYVTEHNLHRLRVHQGPLRGRRYLMFWSRTKNLRGKESIVYLGTGYIKPTDLEAANSALRKALGIRV